MADSVSVSSHHSYGSRVGNSLKAILWGIVLVIISIILLARNENNYVKQKAALEEWAAIVQETTANQVNPDLEWKEIYVSGETASDAEALQDDVFWVVTDNLKLKRTVEMYQWYEDSTEECHDNYWWSEDCETKYTYDTRWDEDPIDSSYFYASNWHSNPTNREFTSHEWEKSPITLWAYTLTPTFISQLTNYVTINLSEQNINIPETYRTIAEEVTQTDEPTTIEDNNNSYLYGDSENTAEENTTVWNTNSNEMVITFISEQIHQIQLFEI